jgi:hypothetical protein
MIEEGTSSFSRQQTARQDRQKSTRKRTHDGGLLDLGDLKDKRAVRHQDHGPGLGRLGQVRVGAGDAVGSTEGVDEGSGKMVGGGRDESVRKKSLESICNVGCGRCGWVGVGAGDAVMEGVDEGRD